MASFGGIKRDCDAIVGELKTQLKSRLCNDTTSPAEMSECVNLLLQLEEPADVLCLDFLDTSARRLDESVVALEKQVFLVSNGGGLMKQQQVLSIPILHSFRWIAIRLLLSVSRFQRLE